MQVSVGTFNLNNLFSRFDFSADISTAKKATVATKTVFSFDDPSGYKLRSYRGTLVKPKPDAERLLDARPHPNLAVGLDRHRAAMWLDEGHVLHRQSEDVLEGLAREVVRVIQDRRKKLGFNVEDRIHTRYEADGMLARAIDKHGDYIKNETLSLTLEPGRADDFDGEQQMLEGEQIWIGLKRA